jgi:prenyltransferase beta subunit
MINQIFAQIKHRFFDYSIKTQHQLLSTDEHIISALNWFKQSLLPDGGVSAKYSMMSHVFSPGYPMATANWLTVLNRTHQDYPHIYKSIFQEDDIARELLNWLLRTQRRDGTFPGSFGDFMNQPPVVFNNGKIIHSLLDFYNASGGPDLIDACVDSADWLLKVQSPDGSWRQFTFHQLSSNTITAAALMRLSYITGNKKYRDAGVRNIEFALSLQTPNGYFKGNGFDSGSTAYNITSAYAISGLFEAGVLEGNSDWKNAAVKGLVPILNLVQENGFLVGEFDNNFESAASYSCLPGNCLLAICAHKMSTLSTNNEMIEKANLLINFVKDRQLDSKNLSIQGGVAGSHPISGNYGAYEISSLGVRDFLEALMLQDVSH